MNLKKMERYLRVNLLGPGPRRMKKEFTGPPSHEGWEKLSKELVCSRSLAGIAGSNPSGGMDACVFWVFCFVR